MLPNIYSVNISANPTIGFVGKDFTFVISSTPASTPFQYTYDFRDGITLITEFSSVSHAYINRGIFSVNATVSSISGIGCGIAGAIIVNPIPVINVSGDLIVGNILNISIANSNLYSNNTISAVNWNLGNGKTSATSLIATVNNSYSATGSYTISAITIDIQGHSSIGTINIGINESNLCNYKQEYITLGGPSIGGRYGSNKQINLVDFLPQNVQTTDTKLFLQVFQDYLNEMFPGYDGFQLSGEDVTVSEIFMRSNNPIINKQQNDRLFTYDIPSVSSVPVDTNEVKDITIGLPSNYLDSDPRISILEKIKRLTELQDPDLIDIEYINFFAKNLGYNIDIGRNEVVGDLGNLASLEDPLLSAMDQEKYLRFVVSNLPSWYKIKTTNNAVKVLLYSFGLVGELINIYTNDYNNNWVQDNYGNLIEIPDGYYPSSHFAININIEDSSDLSFDITRKQNVINAIESVRPINTVFEKLNGTIIFYKDMFVEPHVRCTRYIEVNSSNSDSWYSGPTT